MYLPIIASDYVFTQATISEGIGATPDIWGQAHELGDGMVTMEIVPAQIVIGGSIFIIILTGAYCLFLPRKMQKISLIWAGYDLLGRSVSLLKFIRSDRYILYLRFMGAYFLTVGTFLSVVCIKGGFFSR